MPFNLNLFFTKKNDSIFKIELNNLNIWKNPYTFACMELKCFLNSYKIEHISAKNIVNVLRILKEVYEKADIIKNDENYFVKINNYIIIYIGKTLTFGKTFAEIYYNSDYIKDEQVKKVIDSWLTDNPSVELIF